MDRRSPPSPPFPFPNNKSSFSHDFPLFDFEPQDPNSLYYYQSSSSSYNYNLTSPPPPPPQHMVAPNPNYNSAAYHQQFAAAAHPQSQSQLPTSTWIMNDPTTIALTPTYHNNYDYFTQQQQQQINNALATKAARDNRKMVRQKTINSTNTPGNSSSSLFSSSLVPRNHHNIPVAADHHHPRGINALDTSIISSHNKKLKLIFKKELKNSDVSPLGRIVIPKKDAEENLPSLTSKEGIKLVVGELYSNQQWSLKFKFWSNNKSRMYVLENAGDFLKKNGLKMGDIIILYLDEEYHNYFFSIKRAEEIICEKHFAAEEDAALALMIENLRSNDEQEEEANTLLTMEMKGGVEGQYNNTHMASSSSSHDQHGINFMEEFGSVNHNTLPSFDDICWMGD